MEMEFEWDDSKRLRNLRTHKIDFFYAKEIWSGPVLERPSPQAHHGEKRFLATGMMEGECITVVFTWRNGVRRIISARKARKNEKEDYQSEIG